MKEQWITIKEACQLTGKHHQTIRGWVKKNLVEWKQLEVGKRRSPIYINKLSIPTYLRQSHNILRFLMGGEKK